MNLNWPLMENNITRDDLDVLIEFLKEGADTNSIQKCKSI